ncbi:(2Fe-2S)-binding protein [bacterium]|nr:(2Fe-2S)-binding protein [bacterium]MBU1936677.1 (2Fe-2S)-binding protein [bacterium]
MQPPESKKQPVKLRVNGKVVERDVPADRTLLRFLREDLGLTGTKCGCEIGECGACTVLIDNKPMCSCLVLVAALGDVEVLTVEGLANGDNLTDLQDAFLDHDAVHCGFCTPGLLMSAEALLQRNLSPTEHEIREAISGNLCRCTGYVQIVEAIQDAAHRRRTQHS